MKKFISPGSWFSLEYPTEWHEFGNSEDTFLFYNPNKWNGNFRISATQGREQNYGKNCLKAELTGNPTAVVSRVGNVDCAYSVETFQEGGAWYTSYIWVLDYGKICVECSFTTIKNGEKNIAEEIIRSIYVPKLPNSFVHELIPVRIIEVGEINMAFEWVEKNIKKNLSKDFTGMASDLSKIQQLMDSGNFRIQEKEVWNNIGLAFGSILINEMDGMAWYTYINGAKECPILRFMQSDLIIDPVLLVMERMKKEKSCNLTQEFEKIKVAAEKVLNEI